MFKPHHWLMENSCNFVHFYKFLPQIGLYHTNTANELDSKTHWLAKEPHRTMGCRKFCNNKHLLQVSSSGEWVDGAEFPPSLGSFSVIPKAKHSQPLDCTVYHSSLSSLSGFNSALAQLCSLVVLVASLSPACLPMPTSGPPSLPDAMPPPINPPPSPVLLSTMIRDEILSLVHHPDSTLLPVHSCNTANKLDSKMHWLAKKLHRTICCRKFCHNKHLLQVSSGNKWVDKGEFSPSLGFFSMIPKAKWGQPLDCTVYQYLDAAHMDITFEDCLSTGGFCYALILVDHATWYI
jgi:hypothetical protein